MKLILKGSTTDGVLLRSGRILTDDSDLMALGRQYVANGAPMRTYEEFEGQDIDKIQVVPPESFQFPLAVQDALWMKGYNIVPLDRDKMKVIWNELGKVIEGH